MNNTYKSECAKICTSLLHTAIAANDEIDDFIRGRHAAIESFAEAAQRGNVFDVAMPPLSSREFVRGWIDARTDVFVVLLYRNVFKKAPKIVRRAAWILANYFSLLDHTSTVKRKSRNAARCPGMSGPGWGWWVRAFELANVYALVSPMPYWSGSLPTPSTAINAGVASYINRNAPIDLL
ncbi:MAG: hypothetical protein GYA36_17415 [Veillonellaceae bacterium]|nr:hypothetical protein [Veillonellaceae bacterium]